MDCEQWQQLISLFNDGTGDKTQANALENHLEICEQCRTFKNFVEKLSQPPFKEAGPELAIPSLPALKRPALAMALKAAMVFIIAAMFLHLYMQTQKLQEQMRTMSEQSHPEGPSKEIWPDIAMSKRAFAHYDRGQWRQARLCFEQLALYSNEEETRALALYHMALIATRERDSQSAVELLTQLLDEHENSSYIPSARFLLETMAESAAHGEPAQIQVKIDSLLHHPNNLPPHAGNIMISY